MTTRLHGIIEQTGSWDEEGYRHYEVTYLVQSNSKFDGPSAVSVTSGLPLPGSLYLIGNDNDPWAWCRPSRRIQKHQDNQGDSLWWTVGVRFSNKPPESRQGNQRDPSQGQQNPLLEPFKISISSLKDRENATHDRFGRANMTSSHELLKGPQLEFDISRARVRIEQNVIDAQTDLLAALEDHLNDRNLWGLPPRCVKFCGHSAEPKYYNNFLKYYTRSLEFETDYRTFDRYIPDVGTKVLNGEYNQTSGIWETKQIGTPPVDPNPDNPAHFIAYRDRFGQVGNVALNGRGLPANTVVALDTYSVSIVAGNLGNPLSDSTKWVPLLGTATGDAWTVDTQFYKGQVVTHGGTTYLVIAEHVSEFAPPDADLYLPIPGGLSLQGNYSDVTTYALGAYVRDTERTGIGYRLVQKYGQANLFILGLPLLL